MFPLPRIACEASWLWFESLTGPGIQYQLTIETKQGIVEELFSHRFYKSRAASQRPLQQRCIQISQRIWTPTIGHSLQNATWLAQSVTGNSTDRVKIWQCTLSKVDWYRGTIIVPALGVSYLADYSDEAGLWSYSHAWTITVRVPVGEPGTPTLRFVPYDSFDGELVLACLHAKKSNRQQPASRL